jgi:hypothetical protein
MSVSTMFRLWDLLCAVLCVAGLLSMWLGWQPSLGEIAIVAFVGAARAFVGSRGEDGRE